MKKSLLYLLLLTSAFFSCTNSDDSVFEESADARLNAALASYEKQLVDAQYGWNAVIYPKGGGSFGFFMKFDDKNRVVMYSDLSESFAKTPKESSYRLKAMQTPSLIFDTFSYLHVLADPDDEVHGGNVGEGWLSDFEFAIYPDSVTSDVITFTGRKNQSRLVLTKATQVQAAAYSSGQLANALAFNNISKYLTYFKRVTISGVTYEITVNQDERVIKLTWLEGTSVKSFTTKYYYNSTGLAFATPFINAGKTINGFTNIAWNPNTTQIGLTADGSTGTILSAIAPLSVDLAAPKRWWETPVESGGEWRSRDGFHVNGVEDAFGIKNLKRGTDPYAVWIYIPSATSSYDIFAPTFFFNETLDLDYFYASLPPTFTNGKVFFREYGASTNPPVPTSGPASETAKLMYESSGYYLIQTSDKTYDMVSAKDARAWISWFRN
ncbi:DUF4302 domain-containing protein [Dyadobacter sp. 32]|uniref:DUF4302 domain-containing protein n=1 Tax=Dyadobacter sp. 32 TaxID=538966 RepID=UPI0011F00EDD